MTDGLPAFALRQVGHVALNLEIYGGIEQVGTGGHVRPPAEWRQALTLEDVLAQPLVDQRMPWLSVPGAR